MDLHPGLLNGGNQEVYQSCASYPYDIVEAYLLFYSLHGGSLLYSTDYLTVNEPHEVGSKVLIFDPSWGTPSDDVFPPMIMSTYSYLLFSSFGVVAYS